MIHNLFGEITFNIGWKRKKDINLFGKKYSIELNIQAYFEKDGITSKQEEAYVEFTESEDYKIKIIENLLYNYSDSAESRFIPRTLIFERDGSYALLLDDNDELDGGIAVCLKPVEKIILQDEYL